MIDSQKRQIARTLIARLLACEITNEDFDEAFPRGDADPALDAIYCNIWPYYSERYTHKLEGDHRLKPDAERFFKRCICFLDSGLEYGWPAYRWVDPKYGLMKLVGLGRRVDRQFEEFKAHGDFEVWPFIRRADFERYCNDLR